MYLTEVLFTSPMQFYNYMTVICILPFGMAEMLHHLEAIIIDRKKLQNNYCPFFPQFPVLSNFSCGLQIQLLWQQNLVNHCWLRCLRPGSWTDFWTRVFFVSWHHRQFTMSMMDIELNTHYHHVFTLKTQKKKLYCIEEILTIKLHLTTDYGRINYVIP